MKALWRRLVAKVRGPEVAALQSALAESRARVATLEDYYGLDTHTVTVGGKEIAVDEPEHIPFHPRWRFGVKPAQGRPVRRG